MQDYLKEKNKRREDKRTLRRCATGEEVIYIFEKILEGWKTIRIYNTIIQNNNKSNVKKINVEKISTGNSKIYESELCPERYEYYMKLREKVYQFHLDKKNVENK